jgi:hypothetical protein
MPLSKLLAFLALTAPFVSADVSLRDLAAGRSLQSIFMGAATQKKQDIAPCPGEGPRYGDFKCNHDQTHRVCLKVVDSTNGQCKRREFKDGKDFWDLTGQKAFEWSQQVCHGQNPGDSWCVCKWAFARMVKQVGCENLDIHCTATDVADVLQSYTDGAEQLGGVPHECMKKKCEAQGLL